MKTFGTASSNGGQNLSPLAGIGLADLPNIEGASGHPGSSIPEYGTHLQFFPLTFFHLQLLWYLPSLTAYVTG